MKQSPITTARNDALFAALARGEPLADALQTAHLAPARALQILHSSRWRRRIDSWRRLYALQRSLILGSAVPDSLAAVLRALRDDRKPELQLKAAQAILQLTLSRPARRLPKPPPPPREPIAPESDPIDVEAARRALKEEADILFAQDIERYSS